MSGERKGELGLGTKMAMAGGMLAAGLAMMAAAAQIGAVHLGAGDMQIVLGKGEQGMTMDIAARTCPPHCGFDINWRLAGR
jgi:hypothetical protein